MNSIAKLGLQCSYFYVVAISFLSAGFSSAAVIVDFRGTGFTNPGPATATVTLSDLENDPVTVASPDQGGVFLSDTANDSFPDNDGYTGEIDLFVQVGTVGAGGLGNWDVTIATEGHINGNSPNGWGVHPLNTGNTDNSQISGNELLLFTYDSDFSTTGMNKFIFASARVGGGNWEIWHRTGASSGTMIISNDGPADVPPVDTFKLSDGDMFAIQSVDGTNNRLRTLTFDIVVPEPVSIGLGSLALGCSPMIVRRRRR
ncbi:MAG: hypothetical protein WD738_15230 [Pirellulales bacterium]